ncbi:MAG TPA: hypothetical protein VD736_07455 [Nitrososphaera sp.]|nr:hypothetical protein [Nitrososphaera sp.]
MESALSATRTIEYPADISGCSIIGVGDRQLLYLCTKGNDKPFVVVLGFFSGQKEDIITKDLIEPVAEENKRRIADIVASSLFNEYQNAQIFFL